VTGKFKCADLQELKIGMWICDPISLLCMVLCSAFI